MTFFLCGEIDGRWERLRLAEGVTRVGNAKSNDLVLAASGISRRHAEFEVTEGRLEVRDLESKNGLHIDGDRSAGGRLAAGQQVRLGALELRVELDHSGDAALALVLDQQNRGSPPAQRAEPVSRRQRETTQLISDSGSLPAAVRWLRRAEAMVEELSAGGDDATSRLLELARQAVGAAGAILVGLDQSGKPVVRASAGEVDAAATTACSDAAVVAFARQPPLARSFTFTVEAPQTAIGGGFRPGDAPASAVVVIAPESGEDDAACASFLRLLARLIQRFAVEGISQSTRPEQRQRDGLVFPPGYVVGQSEEMKQLYRQLRALADGDITVLILGDTGVGKEPVAKILHASSRRREARLVAFNCAAIPGDLLEAELFGVTRGAATGVRERLGLFRRASAGTLLLDEIGEMPLALQGKLLRVLQEKEVQPVGGVPEPIDVRVVAATNRNLRAEIEAGTFRADLYYRLAGYTLRVPPLRDRKADLPGLIETFLRRACDELGKRLPGVTAKALDTLLHYDWPGNVRELEQELRRLVYICRDGQPVDFHLLSEQIRGIESKPVAGLDLESQERQLVMRALDDANGRIGQAAASLGISRFALRRRLQRFAVKPSD